MKTIMIVLVLIFLVSIDVSAVECPDGQRYDSYWQKCQNICNSYQKWDPAGQKCVDNVRIEDNTLKGWIVNYTGRVLIERGMDIVQPAADEPVYAGDTVVVDDGARAELKLKGRDKNVVIDKKTKFKILASEQAAKKTSKIAMFFGNLWNKLKNIFGKQEFQPKTPTAALGVRG